MKSVSISIPSFSKRLWPNSRERKWFPPPTPSWRAISTLLIPDYYINVSQQKVEMYQKIAGARSLQEIENIREDVEDRFGHLPEEAAYSFRSGGGADFGLGATDRQGADARRTGRADIQGRAPLRAQGNRELA